MLPRVGDKLFVFIGQIARDREVTMRSEMGALWLGKSGVVRW